MEVIEGQDFKIEVSLEALSVIMRRWGKMDHHCFGSLVARLTPTLKFRKYDGNDAKSSSFAKHYVPAVSTTTVITLYSPIQINIWAIP